MKIQILALMFLLSQLTFANDDKSLLNCELSAHVTAPSGELEKLPKVLHLKMDVLKQKVPTNLFDIKKLLKEEVAGELNFSELKQADSIISIEQVERHVNHYIYTELEKVRQHKVVDFRVKLKEIQKADLKILLSEMGYPTRHLSSADQNIKFEFDQKEFTAIVKFPNEQVCALFSFSCNYDLEE